MRIKADENTEASAASEAVTIRTKTAVASEASVSYDYKAETIQFAETAYEMNTDPAFGASTSLSAGGSITAWIGKTVYIRVKATAEDPAGPVVAVTVPVRPQAPVSAEAEQITSDSIALKDEGSAYEYRLGEQGSWQSAPYLVDCLQIQSIGFTDAWQRRTRLSHLRRARYWFCGRWRQVKRIR